MNINDITIGIVVSPRITSTYNQTIESVRQAGFGELIYVFAEPGEYNFQDPNLKIIKHEEKLGCFKNHNFALNYFNDNINTEFIWLMQDDQIVKKEIPLIINNFINNIDTKTLGYICPWTSYQMAKQLEMRDDDIQEWYESHLGWDSWGVCYIIPTQQLESLLSHSFYINHLLNYKKNQQVDACISETFKLMDKSMWFSNPSLVDHVGECSTLGHGVSYNKLRGFRFNQNKDIELHIFTNSLTKTTDTKMIHRTYRSFCDTFGNELIPTVWCDKHPNLTDFPIYFKHLTKEFPVVHKTNSLSDGYIKAIQNSKSPYLFMLEHDWGFIKDNINHSLVEIIEAMKAKELKHFRFNKRSNIVAVLDHMMIPSRHKDLFYCKSNNVSNNPHIINRKFYNNIVIPNEDIKIESGSLGIEQKLLKNHKYFSYIYGKPEHPPTIEHLDGYNYNYKLFCENKINAYANNIHYFQHLIIIWEKLPKNHKEDFYVTQDLLEVTKSYNTKLYEDQDFKDLLVAGMHNNDYPYSENYILISHGASQPYYNKDKIIHGPGSDKKSKVGLFLNNHDLAQTLNLQRYPKAEQAIIGCPKLDKWHQRRLLGEIKTRGQKPVIAISFHFECNICQETRSAWEYYKSALSMLSHKNMSQEWEVLGHGHPRIIEELKPYYEQNGIEVVHDFEEVMERADLYIMDHMSTLYEFASTDRPVVVLNAPWYRRNVEHGLRYWEYADVGINCNHPNDLENCINSALEDPLEQKMKRERACNAVYAYRDGMCTERAVKAIVDFLNGAARPLENTVISNNKDANIITAAAIRKQKWFERN